MVAVTKRHINEQLGTEKEPALGKCFSAVRIIIANTRG